MSREIFSEENLHPAIRDRVGDHFRNVVEEVQRTIADNDWVVVGMAQNPFPKKARKALDQRNIAHRYLEYGSYTSGIKSWRRRNALKMWTGWPTFPMIFHKGVLLGGYSDLEKLIETGSLPD